MNGEYEYDDFYEDPSNSYPTSNDDSEIIKNGLNFQ